MTPEQALHGALSALVEAVDAREDCGIAHNLDTHTDMALRRMADEDLEAAMIEAKRVLLEY